MTTDTTTEAAQTQTFKKFVLYVAQDLFDHSIFDKGSRECLKVIPEHMKEEVLVQSCEQLISKHIPIPEWLVGTPTLICLESKQCYRGSEAVEKMRTLDKKDEASKSLDEMEGMTARGERLLFSEENFDSGPMSNEQDSRYQKDGKVSEEDLFAYMEQRKKSSGGTA